MKLSYHVINDKKVIFYVPPQVMHFVNGKIPFQIFISDDLGQNIWNKRFFFLFVPIYFVQDCLREKFERKMEIFYLELVLIVLSP